MWDHQRVVRILLALFALTVFTWALAAFVPLFQGWHHLAKLGLQFLLYLLVMTILLQGFRGLVTTPTRSRT
jgi:hypothetical protein